MDRRLFQNRLIGLRGNKTRKQVANEMGINPQTLERYEKGERLPDIEIADIIANYYNVSIDWLIGNEKERITNEEMKERLVEYTGLSENAIDVLNLDLKYNEYDDKTAKTNNYIISELIVNKDFRDLIYNLLSLDTLSQPYNRALFGEETDFFSEKLSIKGLDIYQWEEYFKNNDKQQELFNPEFSRYRNMRLIEKINDLFDHSEEYLNYSYAQIFKAIGIDDYFLDNIQANNKVSISQFTELLDFYDLLNDTEKEDLLIYIESLIVKNDLTSNNYIKNDVQNNLSEEYIAQITKTLNNTNAKNLKKYFSIE